MRLRSQLLLAASLILLPTTAPLPSLRASDHADTAENYNRPGADLADVYIFPSPINNNNVVLVMNVHPLIPSGQAGSVSFDPNVLYQYKIDTTGDAIEDLVIQVRFTGVGANQRVSIAGPLRPAMTGTTSIAARANPNTGVINQTFMTTNGIKVFAGARSDPFFFDLARFFQIFPDRQTPGTGKQIDFGTIMDADNPQANGFRGFAPGSGFDSSPASDLLTGFNVLSIVVELPRSALGGGLIRLWETTSIATGGPNFHFIQQDRLARPAVNEALATVTARRHEANNKVNPVQNTPGLGNDSNQIQSDILAFMSFPARRSPDVAAALASVLVPDVMKADLSNMTDNASYLGFETGGFTGGKFGGRKLPDDVIDIDLLAIFGPVIPLLGLAQDDNAEKPQYQTDNIGPHSDYQIGGLQPNGRPYPPVNFPYLGNPL